MLNAQFESILCQEIPRETKSNDTEYPHYILNKAIRDGRPRPPRHQVGWDIVKHTQTNRHTNMGITIPRPPPMGGEVTTKDNSHRLINPPLILHTSIHTLSAKHVHSTWQTHNFK